MDKKIFKQPKFYFAILTFSLAIFYLFQEASLAKFAGFIWLLNSIFNFYLANRAVKKPSK